MIVEHPVAEISILTVDRLGEIARLGPQFFVEGSLPGKFVPEIFINNWRSLIQNEMGILFGIEKDRQIVGALGAVIFPDPNDGKLVATEMFWFVDKGHRGCGLGLLDAFESWAKTAGVDRTILVHLENLTPRALERVYRSRGYRPIEVHYLKEI